MTGVIAAAGAAAAAGVVMASDEDGFDGSAPVAARLLFAG
jgi:hypothetical protein